MIDFLMIDIGIVFQPGLIRISARASSKLCLAQFHFLPSRGNILPWLRQYVALAGAEMEQGDVWGEVLCRCIVSLFYFTLHQTVVKCLCVNLLPRCSV